MLRLQAYRFEIRPSPEQANYLQQTAGAADMSTTGRWPSRTNAGRKDKDVWGTWHWPELTAGGIARERPGLAMRRCIRCSRRLIDLKKAFLNFQAGRAEHPYSRKRASTTRSGIRIPCRSSWMKTGRRSSCRSWVGEIPAEPEDQGRDPERNRVEDVRAVVHLHPDGAECESRYPSQSKVGIDMGIARSPRSATGPSSRRAISTGRTKLGWPKRNGG